MDILHARKILVGMPTMARAKDAAIQFNEMISPYEPIWQDLVLDKKPGLCVGYYVIHGDVVTIFTNTEEYLKVIDALCRIRVKPGEYPIVTSTLGLQTFYIEAGATKWKMEDVVLTWREMSGFTHVERCMTW